MASTGVGVSCWRSGIGGRNDMLGESRRKERGCINIIKVSFSPVIHLFFNRANFKLFLFNLAHPSFARAFCLQVMGFLCSVKQFISGAMRVVLLDMFNTLSTVWPGKCAHFQDSRSMCQMPRSKTSIMANHFFFNPWQTTTIFCCNLLIYLNWLQGLSFFSKSIS